MIATNLEQSRKLVELGIDTSTADMHYAFSVIGGAAFQDMIDASATLLPGKENRKFPYEPAWSLSALLAVLPKVINNETLFIETSPALWHIGYRDVYTARADNPVDACYELILKLNELNLL